MYPFSNGFLGRIKSRFKGKITIGKGVGHAPNCVLYPYNHGIAPGKTISTQPLESKRDIIIEEEAWLGFGVTVLDGQRHPRRGDRIWCACPRDNNAR
jgi:acetyltransferase-like isoleucine patch superfamily enzyme